MTTLADLYREVGTALHKAQLAGYSIVSIYILLCRTATVTSIQEFEESYWSKKTLGQLLQPVIDSGRLPEEAKLFLQTFRNARIHLAHSLFVSSPEIHTLKGIESLLRETAAMQEVFDRAFQFFDRLLADLARPHGIDADRIQEQTQFIVLSLERNMACATK